MRLGNETKEASEDTEEQIESIEGFLTCSLVGEEGKGDVGGDVPEFGSAAAKDKGSVSPGFRILLSFGRVFVSGGPERARKDFLGPEKYLPKESRI
jgi:hypothetical protein